MGRKFSTLILSVVAVLSIGLLTAYGESAVTNVSSNCSVTSYNAGDEVRLQVSTKEMSICTFIAYVEYNSDELEYVGYEGGYPEEPGSVYLEYANGGKAKYKDVTVEHAESKPLVGMYSVGTEEKSYKAANPLVTLVFKAKTSGTVSEQSFAIAETSDGADGYTSESIRQASAQADSDEASESEGSKNKSGLGNISSADSTAIWIISAAVVVIVLIILLVIKRRKKNK